MIFVISSVIIYLHSIFQIILSMELYFNSCYQNSLTRFVSAFLLNIKMDAQKERRKMNFREFVCAVEKKINEEENGGIRACIYTAKKNNGVEKTGVVIMIPDVNISPTIYLEEFYERFIRGESLECIVAGILRFYESVKFDRSWDVSGLTDYNTLKSKVVFKIVNTEKNKELLKRVPHKKMLDLSIVYYLLLEAGPTGTATMLIYEEHIRKWNITKEELNEAAFENVKKLLPVQFFPVSLAIEELIHPAMRRKVNLLEEDDIKNKAREPMYVLTNVLRSFGAACVVYPEILHKIGEFIGGDYYILPSSVHEVIVVPLTIGMGLSEMSEMVNEINFTQVEEEEILSDHAYIYEYTNKCLYAKKD